MFLYIIIDKLNSFLKKSNNFCPSIIFIVIWLNYTYTNLSAQTLYILFFSSSFMTSVKINISKLGSVI